MLIKIASADGFTDVPVPFGHGGRGETGFIMAGCPETVDMAALDSYEGILPEWLLDADQATVTEGKRWLEACINGWVTELTNRGV